MRYPVVLHTDDQVRFGVTVPDLPGCFSGGDTLDDALESVREAIDLHLQGTVEGGGEVPAPSPVAELHARPEFSGGTSYVWSSSAMTRAWRARARSEGSTRH